MRLLQSTVIAALLVVIVFTSCKEKLGVELMSKTGLAVNGDQIVPTKPGSGNGTLDVVYNKSFHTLTYTVSWNSLTSNVNGIRLNGSAAAGYNAAPLQVFTSGFPAKTAGSFTGTVYIDGSVLKEEDLLRGEYYITVYTVNNPSTGTGEIRGQITF